MKLSMIGCSHHNSPIEVRGRLAFSPSQVQAALSDFRERFPGTEAVLLSTCNRVELYTATAPQEAEPTHEQAAKFLAGFHGLALDEVFDSLFERRGEDVIRHLFMVAASLDSMVVGEPQILAQVKQAYELASLGNATGPLTNQVFQAALRTARRVARETSINEKRVSIASVAVAEFAQRIFERFDDKRVLVIGAGEMAEETLRYLRQEGAREIVVVNRGHDRARELADQWQGSAAPWERLGEELLAADLVVSATAAGQPIVTLDAFQPIAAAREQRTLFILDLAVPRDFDPAIGDCLGVYLFSLDDLRAACERNRAERELEWPLAMQIVEQETANFMTELHHRATAPIIRRLKEGWQQPKDDELRRLFNKLPDLNDRAREEIRLSFDRLVNKLLHPPLESLRDEAQHGTPHALLDAIKRLFGLKDKD